MLLDKLITTLVQFAVMIAIYVPLIIGYKLWARRRMRRAIGAPIVPGACICGKWEMPVGVGVEIALIGRGPFPPPPTAVMLHCPKCGVPAALPIDSTMMKGHAMLPPTGPMPKIPLRRV